MNHWNKFALGLILVASSGCAHLKSVSITSIPKDRSKPIRAEASTWAIFGLYFSNSFADEAVKDLRSQCPNGRVSGVFTKYDGRRYVLWTTRKVTATAYCEAGPTAATPAGARI